MDVLSSEGPYLPQYINTTFLPTLLLSLVTEKNAPDTRQDFSEEYDFIVVGGGTAGSVLANRLSESPHVNVLLLEAGKAPPHLTDVPIFARAFISSDIDWQFLTAPQEDAGDGIEDKRLPWPSGKTLGGTGILNSMIFSRGNRLDYDGWSAQGADGWSYEEVLPYFKKLEDNTDPQFVANGYHGVGGPITMERSGYISEIKSPIFEAAQNMGYKIVDPNGQTQIGFYDNQYNMRRGRRCSMAKAYLVPAENRTNLHIIANAMVRKVVMENQRAVGVEFDFAGSTRVVKATREVILSAGAVNSAKLLMLSGIGPRSELQRHNISVVADLPVGLNLQDHYGALELFEVEGVSQLLTKIAHPSSFLTYVTNRTGIWSSSAGLSATAFLNSDGPASTNELPDHQLYFAEVSTFRMRQQLRIRQEYFDAIFSPYLDKSILVCISLQQRPQTKGNIRLNSSDPSDPPIIDPRYFGDPADFDSIIQGLRTCREIGASEPMRNVGVRPFSTRFPGCADDPGDPDAYYRCVARSIPIASNHQCCTAKMGKTGDSTAVVDPMLRVKNTLGLRVVDASIMPVIPSGNTNIPTAMIAEKAADMIKNSITHRNSHRNRSRSSRRKKLRRGSATLNKNGSYAL